jgi:pimeloyl-ACP methyl ester carboxylesterase
MTTEQLRGATTPDGTTLRYVDKGTGKPPMLFLHGWTCNLTTFRDQVPYFAKNRRVVAYDQRGHGESDKPDQDYSVDGFVEDAVWLIKKLDLQKPVLVGHSMGGIISLNIVRRHPELASAVIFIDSTLLPLPEASGALVEPLYAGLQTPAYASVAEGFARMAFFNAGTDPALVEELLSVIKSTPQRLMYTAMKSLLDERSIPGGPIPVPSLYIGASEPGSERVLASEDGLRDRYPGIDVVRVPAAHFVQMEQPAATNKIIKDFLDR